MEDYLAARMITTPLCLYDCDAPCDGSTVVIVSHRDFAQIWTTRPCTSTRWGRPCGGGRAGTSSTT